MLLRLKEGNLQSTSGENETLAIVNLLLNDSTDRVLLLNSLA